VGAGAAGPSQPRPAVRRCVGTQDAFVVNEVWARRDLNVEMNVGRLPPWRARSKAASRRAVNAADWPRPAEQRRLRLGRLSTPANQHRMRLDREAFRRTWLHGGHRAHDHHQPVASGGQGASRAVRRGAARRSPTVAIRAARPAPAEAGVAAVAPRMTNLNLPRIARSVGSSPAGFIAA
jgi:hypothetical protein